MKRIRHIVLVLLIAFVLVQFVRPARNQNGQVFGADISKTYSIPNNAYALFKNACYDCHSNKTSYPWYFHIQPIGWVLAKDIEDGKAMLNFSEFGSLSSRRQMSRLQDIERRIKDGTMPLPVYQFMHPGARLTDEEKQLLIDWIEKTKDTINAKR